MPKINVSGGINFIDSNGKIIFSDVLILLVGYYEEITISAVFDEKM